MSPRLAPVYRALEAGIHYDEHGPRLRPYVNFNSIVQHPIHGWFYFKEGFAPGIVHWACQRFLFPRHPDHLDRRGARRAGLPADRLGPLVLDPFAGSGTTPLTCQMMGIDAYGVEINPFLAFLSQAKLTWTLYEPDEMAPLIARLLQSGGQPTIEPPSLSSFYRLFTPAALDDLLLVKERIAALDNPLHRQFFQLGLAAVVERVSLARKDGKGLRIIRRPFEPEPVREALLAQWGRMLHDLHVQAPARDRARLSDSRVQRGDARRLIDIANDSIDLMVYSPPYLNSFDYTEVYKLETWLLDFVQTATEFRELRGRTLRSHVSAPIPQTAYLDYAPLAELMDVLDHAPHWNPRVPAMIRGYFDDMYLALCEQARALRRGGTVVCVVANSAYAGIPIPVDVLLARIGEQAGLEPVGIFIARRMKTSAQQLAGWGSDRSLLRESAVVLRKV